MCGQPEHIGVVDCDPYYKYPKLYHLYGLLPVCLLHEVRAFTGVDDPGERAAWTGELARPGHPHEFHSYEGLSHYVPEADNATGNWRAVAWQMW